MRQFTFSELMIPVRIMNDLLLGSTIALTPQLTFGLLTFSGITEKECHLINGCFKKGQCYFPVTSGKIQIKSGEDRQRNLNPTGRDIFGQPQCLPFNLNAKPQAYLSNYHNCRLSGCAVDPIIGYQQIKRICAASHLVTSFPTTLNKSFGDMCNKEKSERTTGKKNSTNSDTTLVHLFFTRISSTT